MNGKTEQRLRRKMRIRKKVFGSAQKPRLSVYKSLNPIYAQLIDDFTGKTLASSSSLGGKFKSGNKLAAELVGTQIAEKAKGLNIDKVCFDRNGFLYHGVIKSLADSARKAGLQF